MFEGIKTPTSVVCGTSVGFASRHYSCFWRQCYSKESTRFGERGSCGRNPRRVWVELTLMDVQFPILVWLAGGIIRDHEGDVICGFHGSIGYSNILHTELIALFHGIEMCSELRFK